MRKFKRNGGIVTLAWLTTICCRIYQRGAHRHPENVRQIWLGEMLQQTTNVILFSFV